MSCLFFFEAAPSTEIKRPSDGGVEFVKVHELVWMIKGSLEDTSELRRVEERCDWKGEGSRGDVN